MLICILGASALKQAEEYTLQELPTFKIDLDMDPELRFQEVVTYFKEPAMWVINYYLDLIPDFLIEDIFIRLDPYLLET